MKNVITAKYSINADQSSLNINGSIKYNDYPTLHDHDYFEVVVVMDGQYRNFINDSDRDMVNSDACLIKPEDQHKIIAKTKVVKHLNILIKSSFIKRCCQNLSSSLFDLVCNKNNQYFNISNDNTTKIITYLNSLYLEKDETKKELIEKLIVNLILNEIIEQKDIINKSLPKFLVELLNEMSQEKNLNWTAKEVANKTHYSQIHLERIFKKYFGVTIIKYMQNIKMGIAVKYLLYSNKTVGEISNLLGYSDVSHFNHIFKDYYKTSPLQFKKNNSKDNYYNN